MDFPINSRRTVAPTAAIALSSTTSAPRRVLVTGGAGFIGSHLCERLLDSGCDVLCVDNFFTGTRRNIEHLLDHPRFEFLRHDITFPLYVEVDEIYNLACPASPIHYQYDPVQTTKTSVHGAINMLGLAKRLRGKILQASTSEVYGDPEVHPQTEDPIGATSIRSGRAPAMTRASVAPKRCSSTIAGSTSCESRWRASSIPTGRACIPTTGASCRISSFRPCNNQPITIYGDGQQTRSFCYVDDLVDGMIGLMNTPDKITGPMNCGNPERIHHP